MSLLPAISTPLCSPPHMIHILNQHDPGSAASISSLAVMRHYCPTQVGNRQSEVTAVQPRYKSTQVAEIKMENM